jgi:NAD(P)-dependent dehydrogenase (short-subunit alcohol dehydrogenase family)
MALSSSRLVHLPMVGGSPARNRTTTASRQFEQYPPIQGPPSRSSSRVSTSSHSGSRLATIVIAGTPFASASARRRNWTCRRCKDRSRWSPERVRASAGPPRSRSPQKVLALSSRMCRRKPERKRLGPSLPRGERLVKTDVSRAEDVASLIQRTIQSYGQLDFAFNNAGIEGMMATTAECTEANWDRTLAVNLKGVWLCMKHELQHMLVRRRGAIVNCSSIAGLVGFQGLPAYVASKHGIVGLTRTAAIEYARLGIRINAVCPGVIATPMVDRIVKEHPEMEGQLTAGEPVGRIGRPEEIAAAVLWLCSGGASFVTGQAVAVDGGWIAQ